MTNFLVVSNLILWILVLAFGVIAVALARQVGVLFERIAPAGALAMNRKLAGGDVAPTLRLRTIEGEDIEIGKASDTESRDKAQLIFFLAPGCPICKTLLPAIKSIAARERGWLDLVLASDGESRDAHVEFIDLHKIGGYPYVLSRSLGVQFGVSQLPFAVLVDRDGRISGLGLTNSREHLESLIETQMMKVATIQEHLELVDFGIKAPESANSRPQ
ncbi:MAG: methylamine dehydrogenase [Gammaproteobacteria bacterium]|nr:methylamine dehydrogenase [Gammaproteobacteria bacterium]MYH33435.1 methylamine dehydrogenase [Gammaproteobacteria bacterium]